MEKEEEDLNEGNRGWCKSWRKPKLKLEDKNRNGRTGDGRSGGKGKDLDKERKDLKKLGFDKI